jgi:hypothetical protein
MHFVEKMLLFNREFGYKIHSGSGLAGSGSEMIYFGSLSGSGSDRIRIRNTDAKPLILLLFAGQTDESLSTDCELDLLESEDEEDEAALEQRIARYQNSVLDP